MNTFPGGKGFNLHVELSIRARGLPFGLSICLSSHFVNASIEGSEETVLMCRLVWISAGCLCDKHQNFMCLHQVVTVEKMEQ